MTETLVIAGATRFHGINWDATNALRAPQSLCIARTIAAGRWWSDERSNRLHREFRTVMAGWGCPPNDVPWPYRLSEGNLTSNAAVPLCAMVAIQEPVTIDEALERGLSWSMECAKKLGLIIDGRPPLARVGWAGSRRAYLHALECETCQHEGIAHCEAFPRIANRELDPDAARTEELVA